MANILSLSVYGINGSDVQGGATYGLTVAQIQAIMPARAGTTSGGVSIYSIVSYKKNAAGINNIQYFSPTAVATIITAANT